MVISFEIDVSIFCIYRDYELSIYFRISGVFLEKSTMSHNVTFAVTAA